MTETKIRRRKVFYLPGFDPRSELHYQLLYKFEGEKWGAINNKELVISKLDKNSTPPSFQINNLSDDIECEYSILSWADIIKPYWSLPTSAFLMRAIKWYKILHKTIDWPFVSRFPNGPIKLLFFPLISLLLIFLFSIFLLCFGYQLFSTEHTAIYLSILLLGVSIFAWACYYLILKVKSMWTLRMFIFHHQFIRQTQSPLHARLEAFAQQIAHCLNERTNEFDEVLLVCHSYSTTLAPSLLLDIAQHVNTEQRKKLHFLSIANLFPLSTAVKIAHPLHAKLRQLSASDVQINWLDISSPADGACYFGSDPFAPICTNSNINYVYKSPRFHKVIESKKYAKLKKNKFELHFQYFYSADKNSPTNYFQLTAGNLPIASALSS